VEARVQVHLTGGRRINALTFLSDVAHPQWAGALTLERQAELISGAVGLSGRNEDYSAIWWTIWRRRASAIRP